MAELSENLNEEINLEKENLSFPLSPLQLGMYLTWKKYPGEDYDNHTFAIELSENYSLNEIEKAWNSLVKRHFMLRALILLDDSGRPHHHILKNFNYSLTELHSSKDKGINNILNKDRSIYFQIDKKPGFRPGVIRDKDKTWFYFSFSHLYLDGQGMYLLMDELIRILKKEELKEPQSYKSFAKCLESNNQLNEEYWKKQLSNFNGPSLLSPLKPFYPSRGKRKSKDYVETRLSISKEKTNEFKSYAKKNSVSVHNIVQTAWGLTLARYTGENHVLFGSVRRGRVLKDNEGNNIFFDKAVGLTINSLPFSFDISKYKTLKDLIKACKKNQKELRHHERAPLNEIKSLAGIRPDEKLFDSVLTYENRDLGDELKKLHPDIATGNSRLFGKLAIPFSLAAFESETIDIEAGYYTSEFDDWFIEDILDYFKECLSWIVKNEANSPLSFKNKLSIKQKQRLDALDKEKSKSKTNAFLLHQKFKETSKKYPNKQAIKNSDGSLITYKELEDKSNNVAKWILENEFSQGTRAAIISKKGITEISLLLGCLKAGISFVPVPVNYPVKRIKEQLKVANCSLVISEHKEKINIKGAKLISPLELFLESEKSSSKIKPRKIKQSDEAFLLFTSGSTGTPKAVPTNHFAFSKFIGAETAKFNIKDSDTLSQFAAMSFDVHLEEIFLAALTGATLKICPENSLRSAKKLVSFIEKEKISILNLPTSFFSEIGKQEHSPTSFNTVRVVITGGEKVSVESVKKWYKIAPKSNVYNTYGPTETTPASTAFLVNKKQLESAEHSELLPIGEAFNHADIKIIDQFKNPLPLGVWGEMIIGGDACFDGYLHNDTLNEEKLILINGKRYFRSGDRVRKLSSGDFQISGRIDNQLKIRGNRFEPEEIELVLETYSGVKSAAVSIVDKKLSAFLEIKETEVSLKSLRSHLSKNLPSTLIPQNFYIVKELPQTSSRKIDRKVLIDFANTNNLLDVRNSQLDKSLSKDHPLEVEIWNEVIGSPPQHLGVNFFEAGGDSLSFLVVVSKLEQTYNCELNAGELFKNPTFENIINSRSNNTKKTDLLIQMSKTKGNSNGSLVLLHPVDGNLYCYGNLAAELTSKVNIWGTQLEGFHKRFNGDLSLKDYAKEYAEAIKKLPAPITLAGYSTGGCLAFEIAAIYEKIDTPVKEILLFDSYCPGISKLEININYLKQSALDLKSYFKSFIKMNKSELRFEIEKYFKTLKRRSSERKELLSTGLQEEAKALQNKTRLNLKLFTSEQIKAIYIHLKAVKKWQPKETKTSVVLFRSSKRGFFDFHQPWLGWEKFLKGNKAKIDLECGHYDFFSKSTVKKITDRILN